MRQARLWVYGMSKHSCQSFVPVRFWFSDSAGLMWPRDPPPWLPERDSDRAVGPWRTRLLSGRANCRGLSEICVVRPLYVRECVWIGRLQAVVADVVWLNAAERRVRRLSCCVSNRSSLALLTCGSLWYLLLITLFYKNHACQLFGVSKGVVEALVSMQRERKCVLRVHPSQVPFQLLRWIRGKCLTYRLTWTKLRGVFMWPERGFDITCIITSSFSFSFLDHLTFAFWLPFFDWDLIQPLWFLILFILFNFRGCCRARKRVQGKRGANHWWQHKPT